MESTDQFMISLEAASNANVKALFCFKKQKVETSPEVNLDFQIGIFVLLWFLVTGFLC